MSQLQILLLLVPGKIPALNIEGIIYLRAGVCTGGWSYILLTLVFGYFLPRLVPSVHHTYGVGSAWRGSDKPFFTESGVSLGRGQQDSLRITYGDGDWRGVGILDELWDLLVGLGLAGEVVVCVAG